MTIEPVAGLEEVATDAPDPLQDKDWTHRWRTRLREALVVLGEQDKPIKIVELHDFIALHVPLNAYDASSTASGSRRTWTNLGWNLHGPRARRLAARHQRGGLTALSRWPGALAAYPNPMAKFEAASRPTRPGTRPGTSSRPTWPPPVTPTCCTPAQAPLMSRAPAGRYWIVAKRQVTAVACIPVWSVSTTSALRNYLDATPYPIASTLTGARRAAGASWRQRCSCCW